MNAKWHRVLMTAAGVLAGFGGLLGVADAGALGINPAWLSLVAGGLSILGTVIRANWEQP